VQQQRRSGRPPAHYPAMIALRLLRAGLVLGCCAGLLACLGPEKDTHPQQVLTKRRALFKQYTRMLEPIGLVANGRKPYQREAFLAMVEDLDKLSDKPWNFFPPDGNYPPTRARPEVWSQPERFRQAQQEYRASVSALLQVAQRGDAAAVAPAVDAVVASCKACHRNFRNE
jgi:cytochrome c556